jgi:hypothetical protein
LDKNEIFDRLFLPAVVIAAGSLAGTALCLFLSLAPEVCVFFGRKRLSPARVAALLHALVLIEPAVAFLAYSKTTFFNASGKN